MIGLSAWGEFQWQQLSISSDYSGLQRIDTTFLVKKTAILNFPVSVLSEQTETKNTYTWYAGVGMPITYIDYNYSASITPIAGLTNQAEIRNSTIINLDQAAAPFAGIIGSVTDNNLGLCLKADVRVLLGTSTKPGLSIAVVKKFNMKSLLGRISVND